MNKKFLSAILFGALMVTSTGTFVSCKDYDDDIQDLQTQINSNKDAIAALQKLVGEGNWVTSVSSIANGFTVTMSNGQTTTITGINGKDGVDGKDGKDGVEWTIGEDGCWYKDGDKTDFVAVAKNGENGKPGATAPSPTINADGMWVVYELDAATGEFVAKTTEISAQGTAAYVVKKDGVYVLHIADETGAFQDVTLPATSDVFVAEAPAAMVHVTLQEAKWKTFSGKEHKERLAKLTEAFPEIANYKKDDLMKQGGNLPVIISPANVELNDNFTFSLQGLDGKVSGAILSNPQKGLVGKYEQYGSTIYSRAADEKTCLWTLSLELEKNKKGDQYVDITKPHSLVVENEKGTAVRTAYAYQASKQTVNDVRVYATGSNTITYADEIDVFVVDETRRSALFTMENEMNGHFILEVAEPADVEKYGITVEGSKLKIANFPAGESGIWIRNVKVTALGLNGSTAEATRTIRVNKKIEAESALSDKTITLSATKANDGKYWNKVRWNVSELNMTAAELETFMQQYKEFKVTYMDEDDQEQLAFWSSIEVYDQNGAVTNDYKKAVTFGFNFESKELAPREYDVLVTAGTIYAAEAKLTVVNPTSTVIALYPELVKDGVLQIVGTPGVNNDYVTYAMPAGLKVADVVAISEIVDMDADPEDASTSWMGSATDLRVYKNGVKVNGVAMNQLYTVRNFKAKYTLFGNSENVEEFEFQGEVVSELYNADATAAIVLDETKLSAIIGGTAKEKKIDLTAAITKAIVAAGPDRGKTYQLFDIAQGNKTETTTYYNEPKSQGDNLIKGTSFVVIAEEVWASKLGYTAEQLADGTKLYFTTAMWNTVWNVAKNYYDENGKAIEGVEEVADADQDMVDIFNAYKGKIDFKSETTSTPQAPKAADKRVKAVKFEFADKATAGKFVASTSINTAIIAKDAIDEDIPNGKVTLAVKMTVEDQWGMKMVRNFDITLTTK